MPTIIQGQFEWDSEKNESNFKKHGILFEDVVSMFAGFFIMRDARGGFGELRRIAIGLIRQKEYTAVLTYRSGRARLISARRARSYERALYWEKYHARV